MANEPLSDTSPPSAPQVWFARLGLSGKLLLLASSTGIIAAFLPMFTLSVQMPVADEGGAVRPAREETAMLVHHWAGRIGLAGYLLALLCAFALYPARGLDDRRKVWTVVYAALLVIVTAVWIAVLLLGETRARVDAFLGAQGEVTVGSGVYLNLLAALAVAGGAFLKVREERIFQNHGPDAARSTPD